MEVKLVAVAGLVLVVLVMYQQLAVCHQVTGRFNLCIINWQSDFCYWMAILPYYNELTHACTGMRLVNSKMQALRRKGRKTEVLYIREYGVF